jgi:hypothetical protein
MPWAFQLYAASPLASHNGLLRAQPSHSDL